MQSSSHLPYEIWEIILDQLDATSLLHFQHTCHFWRNVLFTYVMNGRLKTRAFKCQRLGKKSDSVIEHTNRLWDTVSLKSNFDLLLTGIGVFSPSTGGGEVIISVDARPLQDPLRPLDLVTCLDSIDDDEHTMTIFSKRPFHMQAGVWWEIALNIRSTQKSYNPYANSMWAKMGENATLQHRSKLKTLQIDFDDKTKDRGLPWRSCLEEGQLPHILFWPICI